jgi:hypothetical protein
VAAAQNWSNVGPSYAELARRRAEPGPIANAWRARLGNEYRGGPVDWTTGQPRQCDHQGEVA